MHAIFRVSSRYPAGIQLGPGQSKPRFPMILALLRSQKSTPRSRKSSLGGPGSRKSSAGVRKSRIIVGRPWEARIQPGRARALLTATCITACSPPAYRLSPPLTIELKITKFEPNNLPKIELNIIDSNRKFKRKTVFQSAVSESSDLGQKIRFSDLTA